MFLDSNLLVIFGDKHGKENFYAKTEKLKAQICRCTRQGLKVMALPALRFLGSQEGGYCY